MGSQKENTRICCMCGSSPSKDPSITLHRFPKPGTRNSLRCELWAKYCFPNEPWSDPKFQDGLYSKHKMLCCKHFTSTCFIEKRLFKTAVPSVQSHKIMSQRTVENEDYQGLVEAFSIPAELHERDGKRYASIDGVMPIHCATEEQVAELSQTTHHYCDVFTPRVLAPLEELAYVRLDENHAEKVFINRSRRVVLTSSDGRLAQWRSAPTFESANRYVAGAGVASRAGQLLSVTTARHGTLYAVSCAEGEGGYFETSEPWTVVDMEEGKSYYGDRGFPSREQLAAYVRGLPPAGEGEGEGAPRPVLLRGEGVPRVALVARGGRQLAHCYLGGGAYADVQYL